MSTPSIGGAIYFALFKDDDTGFKVIKCLKTKPKTVQAFKRFTPQLLRDTDNQIKTVRSHRGTKYTSGSFRQFLDVKDIKQ